MTDEAKATKADRKTKTTDKGNEVSAARAADSGEENTQEESTAEEGGETDETEETAGHAKAHATEVPRKSSTVSSKPESSTTGVTLPSTRDGRRRSLGELRRTRREAQKRSRRRS